MQHFIDCKVMYSATIFKPPRWWDAKQRYSYDNETHRRLDFKSWDHFVGFLRKLSKRSLEGKQNAELISPAIFKPNSKRRNENVLAWAGWAAIDVDDIEIAGDRVYEYVTTKFGKYDFVVYSTASSTIDHPRFRVVFNLVDQLPRDQIKHFWWALNSELDNIADKQTKDLARMYYIPAEYVKANNFFYVNSGSAINIDYLLAKWPYDTTRDSKNFIDRLPDGWKEQVINYRQNKLTNTSYMWTDYNDCPFVNKKMLMQFKDIAYTDGTGRYRMLYAMMISIAGNAIEKQYPITAHELVQLIKQIDRDTANRYQNRPLDIEANNALEYVYKHGVMT